MVVCLWKAVQRKLQEKSCSSFYSSYFEKVSQTNFNSNLDNSIKDCITLIVFLIEGFVRFKASNFRRLH